LPEDLLAYGQARQVLLEPLDSGDDLGWLFDLTQDLQAIRPRKQRELPLAGGTALPAVELHAFEGLTSRRRAFLPEQVPRGHPNHQDENERAHVPPNVRHERAGGSRRSQLEDLRPMDELGLKVVGQFD